MSFSQILILGVVGFLAAAIGGVFWVIRKRRKAAASDDEADDQTPEAASQPDDLPPGKAPDSPEADMAQRVSGVQDALIGLTETQAALFAAAEKRGSSPPVDMEPVIKALEALSAAITASEDRVSRLVESQTDAGKQQVADALAALQTWIETSWGALQSPQTPPDTATEDGLAALREKIEALSDQIASSIGNDSPPPSQTEDLRVELEAMEERIRARIDRLESDGGLGSTDWRTRLDDLRKGFKADLAGLESEVQALASAQPPAPSNDASADIRTDEVVDRISQRIEALVALSVERAVADLRDRRVDEPVSAMPEASIDALPDESAAAIDRDPETPAMAEDIATEADDPVDEDMEEAGPGLPEEPSPPAEEVAEASAPEPADFTENEITSAPKPVPEDADALEGASLDVPASRTKPRSAKQASPRKALGFLRPRPPVTGGGAGDLGGSAATKI